MGVWIEISNCPIFPAACPVTPFVGVWIEIKEIKNLSILHLVTPFVGVWIEITPSAKIWSYVQSSLPLWECGLKFYQFAQKKH